MTFQDLVYFIFQVFVTTCWRYFIYSTFQWRGLKSYPSGLVVLLHTPVSSMLWGMCVILSVSKIKLTRRRDIVHIIGVKLSSTTWFKKMDSISYVYISWTIQSMWMIYITFESVQPCSSVSWEQNGYYAAQALLVLHSSCALGERSSGGIWIFRTPSFKWYVDHSHTMYSSGNIDVRNWVHLF
jgi:hypothetical protein